MTQKNIVLTGMPGSGERAWQSLEILLESNVRFEVRTTVLPGWTAERHLDPLMERLAGAGVRDFVLQGCRTGNILDPALADGPRQPMEPGAIAAIGERLFERFALRGW